MNIKNEDLERALMIKAIIEKEFYKPLKVPHLVQLVGTNKNYLNAAFRYLTGDSTSEYLRKVRIEKAKDLLVHSDDCIDRIATRVGLDRRSLEKQFKKLTEKTPRTWRVENKKGYNYLRFDCKNN